MGKWTEIWDETNQRWLKVYLDIPAPITKGTAYPNYSKEKSSVLLSDGRPVPPKRNPMGFRKD